MARYFLDFYQPPRVMAEMAQEALCALARGCPSVKTCGMEGGGRGSTPRHTPCRFQRQQGTLEGLDVPHSGKLPTGPESRQCPKRVTVLLKYLTRSLTGVTAIAADTSGPGTAT